MFSTTFTSSIIAFAALVSQAEAFWGTAHLLVAREAETLLSDKYPDVLAAAVTELAVLKQDYPDLVKEGNHPFTECATFADDIKGQGYSFQSDWHYINQPYLDEPGTTLDDFSWTQPTYDVVGAMSDFTKFLKGEISASQSYYVSQIAEKFSYESDQRSFALRLIIHYVGDVHQPLHSTTEVDSTYPTSDRGGTAEKIPSKDGVSSLHFVYDSVLYKYTGRPSLRLSDSDWDWYTTEAASLYTQYPVDSSQVNAGDFNEWAKEGLQLSEQYVYPDFVQGQDPDQDYIDKALPVIEEHMMLGSSRLAALMVDIYGTASQHAEMFLN